MEKQTLEIWWGDLNECYMGVWIKPEVLQSIAAFGTSVETVLERLLDGKV